MRLLQNPRFLIGASLLLTLAALAFIAPYFYGIPFQSIDLEMKNAPPSPAHWFGTDDLGRDLFARVCFGIRISLFVGIAAAVIDMVIGVLWGSIAAFAGGGVDMAMMRFADVIASLPCMLIIILLMVVMGPGIGSTLVAMTVLNWITMARIVRGQVLQIKEQEYVLAAAALGAGSARILFREILPNARKTILAAMTLTVPAALFTEAFLSFLGLGVQAPYASLGSMASEALPAMSYYPWRLLFPAGMLSGLMLACTLIGEGTKGQ